MNSIDQGSLSSNEILCSLVSDIGVAVDGVYELGTVFMDMGPEQKRTLQVFYRIGYRLHFLWNLPSVPRFFKKVTYFT